MAVSLRAQQALPVVNIFATGAFRVGEGTVMEVFLSKDQPVQVSVKLDFSGTSIRGIDYFTDSPYIPITNIFVIEAPNATRSIQMPIPGDARDEPDETMVITVVPDPSYVVGPNNVATVTIVDATPTYTYNRPPYHSLRTVMPNTIQPGSNLTIVSYAYDDDDDVVRVEICNGTKVIGAVIHLDPLTTNRFTFAWTNIEGGVYDFFTRAVDTRGAITESTHYYIVSAITNTPITLGSIMPDRTVTNLCATWFDPLGRTNAAVAVFDIPAAPTDPKGYLIEYLSGYASDLYIFEASDTINASDLDAPLIYVGPANKTRIDLSRWLPRFAGKKMGIQWRNRDTSQIQGADVVPLVKVNGLQLHRFPSDNYDVPPEIQFSNIPTINFLNPTDPLRLTVTVSDFDSAPTFWTLALNGEAFTNASFSPAFSGSETVSITLTNLRAGVNTLAFSVAPNAASNTLYRSFSVIRPDEPIAKTRMLGRNGTSSSFYAIDAAGQMQVWGKNDFGELGLGYVSPNEFYNPLVPTTRTPDSSVPLRQVSAARYYAMGLMGDGTVQLWGRMYNSPPALARKVVATDTAAFLLNFQGNVHKYALSNPQWTALSGVWDDFDAFSTTRFLFLRDGQLFDATQTAIPFPAGVSRWINFSIADLFALAIGDDGQMYAWGSNGASQLPVSGSTTYNAPTKATPVPGVDSWKRALASAHLSLAIDSRGRLFSWGASPYVGNSAPIINVPTPVQFPRDGVVCVDMAVTTDTAMALTDKGEVYAWGRGVPGMWQNPNASEAFFPELARGLTNILDPAHPPMQANFVRRADGTGPFAVVGLRSVPLKIEQSDDFLNWSALTNFPNATGIEYLDLNTTEKQKSFLRVVPQ